MTIGEKYGPAMKIVNQDAADRYFEFCVRHTLSHRPEISREEAENIERQNLAYYAGYYDHETRIRIERLFACEHPVFGRAAVGEPSAADAFALGQAFGKQLRSHP